jgi:hypothetical protein
MSLAVRDPALSLDTCVKISVVHDMAEVRPAGAAAWRV